MKPKYHDKDLTKGLQQAIEYNQKLNIEFVYVANKQKIYTFSLFGKTKQ